MRVRALSLSLLLALRSERRARSISSSTERFSASRERAPGPEAPHGTQGACRPRGLAKCLPKVEELHLTSPKDQSLDQSLDQFGAPNL